MEKEKYKLCLYVTGQTQKSRRAIENLQIFCKQHLEGNYSIEIIDLMNHPQLAEGAQIIATPTLIKNLPDPIRIMVGHLSDKEELLVGLNLIRE